MTDTLNDMHPGPDPSNVTASDGAADGKAEPEHMPAEPIKVEDAVDQVPQPGARAEGDGQEPQAETDMNVTVEPQLAIADLEAQLKQAQAQAAEYLDGWQRARAEFANFRRRAEKEREEISQNTIIEWWGRLLPVIDDFERAVALVPEDRRDDELIKGFGLIYRKLTTLLESAGLKPIDPLGQPFDPTYHEALGRDEAGEVPSGHITLVLQKGYLCGERVVRPALVRVAV